MDFNGSGCNWIILRAFLSNCFTQCWVIFHWTFRKKGYNFYQHTNDIWWKESHLVCKLLTILFRMQLGCRCPSVKAGGHHHPHYWHPLYWWSFSQMVGSNLNTHWEEYITQVAYGLIWAQTWLWTSNSSLYLEMQCENQKLLPFWFSLVGPIWTT